MRKRVIVPILVICVTASFCNVFADNILNPGWVPEIKKPQWMPELKAGLTFETKYIWRGQLMVDAPVLEPEASISKWGFTLSWWGNFSTASDQRCWTEHNYIADYSLNMGEARKFLGQDTESMKFLDPLEFRAGHIFYVFPEYSGKDFHSEEFYFGISYDSLLAPFVNWYVDYARGAGSYIEMGIAPSVEIIDGITASAGITTGYNAGQWGYGYKFAPMKFSGEISVDVLKYFTITPNINYSLALDRSRKDNGLAYGSEFYGGIKVSAAL